ncbi:MAG TPA: hypothetical protein VFG69_08875, partial [Nannocystaceae bacterium]|nr:hypothetical protein [Nannocystaceae bacterium]
MGSGASRSIDRARGAARPVVWLGIGAVLALGVQRVGTLAEPAAAEPVRAVTRSAEPRAEQAPVLADVTTPAVAEPWPRDAARDDAPVAASPAAITA